MKTINNSFVRSFSIGEFCGNWYFEIRKDKVSGHALEIKAFGYHLRWYPEYKFFFIRNQRTMKNLIHS